MTRGGTVTPWSGPPPARHRDTTSSPCRGCVRSGRPSTCTIPRCSPWTTRNRTGPQVRRPPARRKDETDERQGSRTTADDVAPSAAHRAVQADAPRGGVLRRVGRLLPAGVPALWLLVLLGADRLDSAGGLCGSVGADRCVPGAGRAPHRRPTGGRPG